MACAILLALTPAAHATYPGANGKITYDVHGSDRSSIYAMNPDGSNPTLLIEKGLYSAWSPDGRRIAYTCPPDENHYYMACTAFANGTAINPLEGGGEGEGGYRPFWSPDARHLIVDNLIYVGHNPSEPYSELWRVDAADGGDPIRMVVPALSGSWSRNGYIAYTEISPDIDQWVSTVKATTPGARVRLTESGKDDSPDWSPDGTKIVFESYRSGSNEIYVMYADGSGETRLGAGSAPAWSPDGTKILFVAPGDGGYSDLWVMNTDGTGATNLTNTPGVYESDPAWQPVFTPYVRPKGATPLRVSLVPAFEPCTEPNRTHGPPLEFQSCNPPHNRPGYAVFGTAEGSQAVGTAGFKAIPGAPGGANDADVEISVNLTDVRRGRDGADALGSIELPVPLRLTDKASGPFQEESGTVRDFNVGILGYANNPLRVEVPCVETADPSVGSTCSATTTVNALFPPNQDPVTEGKRAVWQLDQIAVWDGGEDGQIESRDDNTVLAVQGVFVP